MIAVIDPELRSLLNDETVGAIISAVQRGVTCMICARPMGPEDDGHANAVALRRVSDGDTLIRFTHETCGLSRLIEVDELPEMSEVERAPWDAGLEWALSVRTDVLPMVVLVWDLDCIEQLPVTRHALLASLRLDGLTGRRPVDAIKPPVVNSVSVHRERSVLQIETRHGIERLALDDEQAVRPALLLAAHQKQMLLIVGERLGLGGHDLDEVDRQLLYGDALGAVVAYHDDELAAMPMHLGRMRRFGRGALSLTPSQRRRKRRKRQDSRDLKAV
jgi:hypothetical protein